MNIGCVIMAAGQATRFGENKLLHPLGGQPLLAHVLGQLPRERLQRIVVVASSDGVEALCQQLAIPCLRYRGGPQSETIRLGLGEMVGMDGCLFLMGDQPFCPQVRFVEMLDAFARAPSHVVRLSFQGRACSPTLFPACYFPQLRALTGERGGMSALMGLPVSLTLVQAEQEAELWDSDTKADLQAMEAELPAILARQRRPL